MKVYVFLKQGAPVCCGKSYEDIIDYQIQQKIITETSPVWDTRVCRFVPASHLFTQVTDNWIEGIKLAGIDNYNEVFGETYDYYIHESEFFTS